MTENADNPLASEDDTARLFRENDNVGHSSSYWYRCMRYFFERQSPVGEMTLLTAGPTDEDQIELGVFTFTRKNRLVFWPALTTASRMQSSDGDIPAFDHITLELPSERFHLTAYDETGAKVKVADGLRTFPIGDSGIAAWFRVLAKVEVLRNQDSAIQRKIPVPAGHLERLVKWMDDFAQNLTVQRTLLPLPPGSRDYIYYSMFVASDTFDNDDIEMAEALGHKILSSHVTGWDSEPHFLTQGTRFHVGNCDLVVVTACPPGTLNRPVAFECARRRLRGAERGIES
jgi:hypothetical protein